VISKRGFAVTTAVTAAVTVTTVTTAVTTATGGEQILHLLHRDDTTDGKPLSRLGDKLLTRIAHHKLDIVTGGWIVTKQRAVDRGQSRCQGGVPCVGRSRLEIFFSVWRPVLRDPEEPQIRLELQRPPGPTGEIDASEIRKHVGFDPFSPVFRRHPSML
jgi:hypothetical protein